MGLFSWRVFELPTEQFCMPWTSGDIAEGNRCIEIHQGHVIKVCDPGEQPDKKILRQPDTHLIVVSISPVRLSFSFPDELAELTMHLNVSLDAIEQVSSGQLKTNTYQKLAGFLWKHTELSVTDLTRVLSPIARAVLTCAISEEEFRAAFSQKLWPLTGMKASYCRFIDMADQGTNLAETLLPQPHSLIPVPAEIATQSAATSSISAPSLTPLKRSIVKTDNADTLKTTLLQELCWLLERLSQNHAHSEIGSMKNTLRQCQTKLHYFTPSTQKNNAQQLEALERTLHFCYQLKQEVNEEAPILCLTKSVHQFKQYCSELFV